MSMVTSEKYIVKQALLNAIPVYFTYCLLFFSIGIISHQHEIGCLKTVVMTAFIYASPLQIILIYNHLDFPIFILFSFTISINLRFVLLSFLTDIHFSSLNKINRFLCLFMLSSATFALTQYFFVKHNNGKHKLIYYFSIAISCYILAILMTFVGYILASTPNHFLIEISSMILPVLYVSYVSIKPKKIWHIGAMLIGFLAMAFFR